jgi:hypothetical protein
MKSDFNQPTYLRANRVGLRTIRHQGAIHEDDPGGLASWLKCSSGQRRPRNMPSASPPEDNQENKRAHVNLAHAVLANRIGIRLFKSGPPAHLSIRRLELVMMMLLMVMLKTGLTVSRLGT